MSRQSVRWAVPLSTRTTANARKGAGSNRWATHERNAKERGDITVAAPKAQLLALPHPVVVTITRVHPPGHALDLHDNVPAALKAVVDAIAPLLGFKSDRDPQVAWRYRQRVSQRVDWAVEVEAVGPCRLFETIVDVPEDWPQLQDVDARVEFHPDAAKWARTPPDETCRCPADERHDAGCPLYRPGPKPAPKVAP